MRVLRIGGINTVGRDKIQEFQVKNQKAFIGIYDQNMYSYVIVTFMQNHHMDINNSQTAHKDQEQWSEMLHYFSPERMKTLHGTKSTEP